MRHEASAKALPQKMLATRSRVDTQALIGITNSASDALGARQHHGCRCHSPLCPRLSVAIGCGGAIGAGSS